MKIEDLLFVNDFTALAVCGYFLNNEIVSKNEGVFESALLKRNYGFGKASMSDLTRMLAALNPKHSITPKGLARTLDNLVELNILGIEDGEEIHSADEPFNRKSWYYSFVQDPKIQELMQYIVQASVKNGFDYKASIGKAFSDEGKKHNVTRWEILKLLADKNSMINEIVESTPVKYDNFYFHARPLAKAKLIVAPYLGTEDRRARYSFTEKATEFAEQTDGMYPQYNERVKKMKKYIPFGAEFTRKDAASLFPKLNVKTVNSFMANLEDRGIICQVNKSQVSKKFRLSSKGRRFYQDIILPVESYFSTGRVPSVDPDIALLRKALKNESSYNPNMNTISDAKNLFLNNSYLSATRLADRLGLVKADWVIRDLKKDAYIEITGEKSGAFEYYRATKLLKIESKMKKSAMNNGH